MINRILIRVKTVQLLYSYLLVQKPFSLESQPSSPTKEKRFAYSLYLDIIYLFYIISQQLKGKGNNLSLKDSRFITKIKKDDHLKSLIKKYSEDFFLFTEVVPQLIDEIKNSLIFRDYDAGKTPDNLRDKIWEEIFKAIILPNPAFNDIISNIPGYSLSGVERMKGILDTTFSNFYSTRDNLDDALCTLSNSMEKARELYMRMLALPVDLTRIERDHLETNRKKYLATIEDLNPNMRFVDNFLPTAIEENEQFNEYVEKQSISWISEDRELLEIILKEIKESEIYANYMSSPKNNKQKDIEFWREVFKQIIFNSTDFLEYLENKSIFWNDDLEIIGTFILKTFRRFEDSNGDDDAVMPMYKDEEDAHFGADLFKAVFENKDIYLGYIDNAIETDKWDRERLAFMDVVITLTALAEIMNFPKIPLVVSINEYIEIAKSYSSSKSGSFVHGLLASIISKLQEEKKLIK